MSQTITQPDNTRITLTKTADYRDSYANSVQVRLSIWDFFLVFGTVDTDAQAAPDQIQISNFQGIYLSPQQAKALQNVLGNNLAQYEKTFGPISLDATDPVAQRFVIPSGPVH
jgi:flagellar protein FlaG